jgi:hypothetical protein
MATANVRHTAAARRVARLVGGEQMKRRYRRVRIVMPTARRQMSAIVKRAVQSEPAHLGCCDGTVKRARFEARKPVYSGHHHVSARSARRPQWLRAGLCVALLITGTTALVGTEPASAAQAGVAAGDIVFEQIQSGPPNYPAQIMHRSASGVITNLSNTAYPIEDHTPDVSPDGSRITYVSTRFSADGNGQTSTLMLMNSDGSGVTQLHTATTANWFSDLVPRWSPDGTKIAYIEQRINSGIQVWTMNADGTNDVQRTTTGALNVSWSPDGTRLAYDSANPATGNNQIYIMNADGSNQHMVAGTDSGVTDSAPVWAPDGKRIYFGSNPTLGVWYYSSGDGFTTTSVTRAQLSSFGYGLSGEGYGTQIRVSPDSSTLTFSNLDSSNCIALWTMSASTAVATKLTDTGCGFQNYAPTFVPASWPVAPPTVDLTLTPATTSGPVNTTDVVTASLYVNGSPVSGVVVNFSVTSGPCAGRTATGTTDDTGNTAWGYSCNATGSDTITADASVSDGAGGSVSTSASSTVSWTSADTYVALGDSFSSGEGALPKKGSYQVGTDVTNNRCHRSGAAYPTTIAGSPGAPINYKFFACSGAVIEDFFTPFATNHYDSNGSPVNTGEPLSQLSHLDAATQLITLTVGGNNAYFPDVMAYCATRPFLAPSCRSQYQGAVDSAIANMSKGTGTLHDNLPDLYTAIRQHAPNAKVLVAGYPRFFPSDRFKHCGTGAGVGPVSYFFDPSDMVWINSEIDNMNSVIRQAAQHAGFTYIDMSDAFKGHELCTPKPWMNYAKARVYSASGLVWDLAASYHPNTDGQKAFASRFAGSGGW